MAAITQREAIAYRARVKRLEKFIMERRYNWTGDGVYQGTFIGRIEIDPKTLGIVQTAHRLKHAVAVSIDNTALLLWADPIPDPRDL